MKDKLYRYRFELLLFSQLTILFGSLIIPSLLFDTIILPILFILNVIVGMVFISKRRIFFWLFAVLLLILLTVFFIQFLSMGNDQQNGLLSLGILFPFFVIVTYEIIGQVWRAKEVNKNVILGLISGYISLGIIGALLCVSIEVAFPGSFSGVVTQAHGVSITGNLLYYSYITLLTIGYGEILPISMLAKKSAILIGLAGQFYLVIVTAVVIEKYIRHRNAKDD